MIWLSIMLEIMVYRIHIANSLAMTIFYIVATAYVIYQFYLHQKDKNKRENDAGINVMPGVAYVNDN